MKVVDGDGDGDGGGGWPAGSGEGEGEGGASFVVVRSSFDGEGGLGWDGMDWIGEGFVGMVMYGGQGDRDPDFGAEELSRNSEIERQTSSRGEGEISVVAKVYMRYRAEAVGEWRKRSLNDLVTSCS